VKAIFRFIAHYQTFFALISFVGGFAFGVWREQPIDTDLSLLSQFCILVIVFLLIIKELSYRSHLWTPSTKLIPWWRFHELFSHFLLGGLLRGYTVFFIKSAGLNGSMIFLVLITLLILANELPFVQNRGTLVRTVLWSLALSCFVTYLIPKLMHRLDTTAFTFAILITLIVILLASWLIRKRVTRELLLSFFLWPSLATLMSYLTLYHLALIPPVPLMLARFEIAHRVQKEGKEWYLFQDDRFDKKLWEPERFMYQPGDKVVAAFRLVAPAQFVEELVVRWEYKDKDWSTTDMIPVKLIGGRKAGFRGSTEKNQIWPGEWRVRLETLSGREIGRLRFHIYPDSSMRVRDLKASRF